ncbi:hypothetical protein M514_15336 [Trichuris suis]|uniref:Uncharacterized protein n=1 Tax=Trichuris suis TaxID=68888 RepID=A0A085NSQ4_9BILA|nr:hypothetical protein M514_15336 [Trichuris suis]
MQETSLAPSIFIPFRKCSASSHFLQNSQPKLPTKLFIAVMETTTAGDKFYRQKQMINIGLLAQLAVSNCREVRSVGTCVSSHLPTHYIHF